MKQICLKRCFEDIGEWTSPPVPHFRPRRRLAETQRGRVAHGQGTFQG